MAEMTALPIPDLQIDAENPRLQQSSVGQREALRELATQQGPKLLALSRHILANGLNPGDHFYVMPVKHGARQFVVLEGNRRLAALRALENPDLLAGAVAPSVLKGLRACSREYQQIGPIESVSCLIFQSREEAQPWIVLKHDGELDGAGIVRWGSDDKARYRARMSETKQSALEIQTQALDFLQSRGDLTAAERRTVPATSFKRLLQTPLVRAKMGIEFVGGKIRTLTEDEDAVAKALLFVAKDLQLRHIKTSDIYHVQNRNEYANRLPPDIVVTPTRKNGEGVDIGVGIAGATTRTRTVRPKSAKPRDRLIPRDCVLSVKDPRVADIEVELRRLSLEETPNAVSVLLRVFIELSCDAYVIRVRLPTSEKDSLGKKLQDVARHLVQQLKLTDKQAAPVMRAGAKDSFLAPSVTLMNQYVHNMNMPPISRDLRAQWDSLQPFVIAVWTP